MGGLCHDLRGPNTGLFPQFPDGSCSRLFAFIYTALRHLPRAGDVDPGRGEDLGEGGIGEADADVGAVALRRRVHGGERRCGPIGGGGGGGAGAGGERAADGGDPGEPEHGGGGGGNGDRVEKNEAP